MMRIRMIVFRLMLLSLSLMFVLGSNSYVRSQTVGEGFKTKYSSAIVATPINIVFNGNLDLSLSASGEFSFMKSGRLGFAFAGGYYPYFTRTEAIASFSIRHYGATANGPLGGFFEFSAIIGEERQRASADPAEPLFGIGARVGTIRTPRFSSDLCFEYGAGTNIFVSSGLPQFRAYVSFGIGLLLGKEVLIY